MFSIKRKCYNVIYDIFHMISVRLLECLTPIMWKMDVMSAGAGCLDTKVSIFDSFSSFTLHLDILLNVLAFV